MLGFVLGRPVEFTSWKHDSDPGNFKDPIIAKR